MALPATPVVTVPPENTTIKTVSVKVSRQVDLGYVPYIKYLYKLNGKQPPFGTRDQSRAEIDLFVSAEVGQNDTVENVITMLSGKAHEMSERILRENYADALLEARQAEVPEEAVVIGRTTIEQTVKEDF
jgi:hypothetical protein